jgi:exopolyphosphatase/guanosine-5'-triphosphate,3'-diphosphate pyrophosphatase
MRVKRGRLTLHLPGQFAGLASDRLAGRLRQLARLVGREPAFEF